MSIAGSSDYDPGDYESVMGEDIESEPEVYAGQDATGGDMEEWDAMRDEMREHNQILSIEELRTYRSKVMSLNIARGRHGGGDQEALRHIDKESHRGVKEHIKAIKKGKPEIVIMDPAQAARRRCRRRI